MYIYKYLHEDRATFFDDGLLRFTQPHAFNDPFEFKPHIGEIADRKSLLETVNSQFDDILVGEYQKFPEELKRILPFDLFKKYANSKQSEVANGVHELAKKLTPAFGKLISSELGGMIGVLSLTEKSKNLLMWAHYANSHQGFVVEFDKSHFFFDKRKSDKDELRFLRKVKYSFERPSINLSQTKNFDDFITKGEDWKYEEEWRMLLPLRDSNKVIHSDPFDIHLFKIPFDCVRSVIYGERTSDVTKQIISKCIKRKKETNHITQLQARIDSKEYKINIY